jgi:F-type H+-transporting ATPase subunit b
MRRLPAALALAAIAASPFTAHAAEGMPQLDFGNPLTISQVVWLAIVFVVLYVLLARWALPQVAHVLELRAATIGADLEAARAAKIEADWAVADFTTATREAQASAQASVAAATDAAKAEAAQQSAVLNERLDAQLAEAEQRIGAARASAVGALRQVATETASVVVARLTGHSPDAGIVDHEVGAVMAASGRG